MRSAGPGKARLAVVAVGMAVIGIAAATALASAMSGFTATTLVAANFAHTVHMNSDKIKFETKDPTLVRTQKVVIGAGGYSGWHHHPGVIIVSVQAGSALVWDANCNVVAYGPGLPDGSVFVESGDAPLQVTSTNGATEYATQVAPAANPPVYRIEDDPPACAGP